MNLLYLASTDFPLAKARAIQIVNTCHALARAGRRVRLVVGRRDIGPAERYLSRYGLEPHPNLEIVSVPAIRLPPALARWYSHLWNWSYLLACLSRFPWLVMGEPAALVARDYRMAWLLLK